ncbi:hypothetical protein HW845_13430 [Streptomyces sp. ND05-3B]|nr:hypothetical protein [Streptomyces caniscabiei]UJV40287.1 hypothetical protein CVT30_10865 [Streptomyces sp. AMCC400023]MBE4735855.1 hypothetical protein [Streptomyces caniscabiei]MBE4762617.1 hypothetical protein [Streptomyces caniscabiei]MBE4774216.1 hypothetical protein [Streptomyces caniscabiei]MBE4788563.1 hypothetical protein [Streptomyces caniscabiei]
MLVGAAGAGLLAGCSSGGGVSDGGGDASRVERTRARVARDSEGLVERYDRVIAAHPDLAALLTPLRAEVVRHAEVFGGAKGTGRAGAGEASPSPSGSPSSSSASSSPSASASPDPVPEDPGAALTELAAAERALADKRAKALLEVPGEVARLMASVAAAGAGHAYVLTEGAK